MTKARLYSKQCAEGRQLAAQAVADLAATGNAAAFARSAEAVLARAPGIGAGFWAHLADRLASTAHKNSCA